MEAVHSELGLQGASMHMEAALLVTQALIIHLLYLCLFLDHTYV